MPFGRFAMATHDSSPSIDRLQCLYDSVNMPVETLEEEINRAIAANSNSIAVDLGTAIIVRATAPAEILFGYAPGELKGRSIHDLVPERARDLHKTWFEQYRAAPTSRTMGSRGMQLRGLHRDGHEFPVEIALCAAQVDGLHLGIATVIPMVTREENP